MKKMLLIKTAALAAGVLTFIAFSSAASASWLLNYQPAEPKSLRQK